MDEAPLFRRIRVILVTTRASAHSLRPDDEDQARAAVHRGLALLDGIEADVVDGTSLEAQEYLTQARAELESLLVGPPAEPNPSAVEPSSASQRSVRSISSRSAGSER
jgi:hypothetical protein